MNTIISLFEKGVNYFENANQILECNRPEFANESGGNLWLGNYHAAHDPDFLIKNNITVIINCTPGIKYIYEIISPKELCINKLETFRVPVLDSLLEKDILLMQEYFKTVIPFIFTKLKTSNILIHCAMGRQRSAVLIAAILYIISSNCDMYSINNICYQDTLRYINKYPGILGGSGQDNSYRMNRVIKYINKKRPQAFAYSLRVNFKKTLERYFNIEF
jgi:hypothetical protein